MHWLRRFAEKWGASTHCVLAFAVAEEVQLVDSVSLVSRVFPRSLMLKTSVSVSSPASAEINRCNSASVIRRALPTLTVIKLPALISRYKAERESDVRSPTTPIL